MNLDFAQVISQVLAFLILYWVLKRYGWTPLLNSMEERKRHIQSQFNEIQAQKEAVQKLKDEYDRKLAGADAEGRIKIQEAIEEGRKFAHEIQEAGKAVAKATLKKAKEEAEREIIEAKNVLKNDIVKISYAMAGKILDKEIDEKNDKQLMKDFAEHMEKLDD
jgi:F-type H+-transporting ATPase subunit b